MSEKTLTNTAAKDATDQVSDIEFWGDGDLFKLISKASSQNEGWMKSTKAMDVGHGVVLQVTTQQRNPDGSYAVAEAVTFVPGVTILDLKKEDEVVARFIKPADEAQRLLAAQPAMEAQDSSSIFDNFEEVTD